MTDRLASRTPTLDAVLHALIDPERTEFEIRHLDLGRERSVWLAELRREIAGLSALAADGDSWQTLATELFNLVLADFEWVRAQGGRHSVCPLCHAVCERDGGPGHLGRLSALCSRATVRRVDARSRTMSEVATYRIWVMPMMFKKNGFPGLGVFGKTESNVVIMTTATWKKLCADVPQLQTTQFEVGSQE